jgi:hypothetical protein
MFGYLKFHPQSFNTGYDNHNENPAMFGYSRFEQYNLV